jgi:hypothetical protein
MLHGGYTILVSVQPVEGLGFNREEDRRCA